MLAYNIEINYYSILEVESTATPNEIKKSYRKLSLKHHPDKGGEPDKFKEIANACEILMDEETRRIYDHQRIIYDFEHTRKSTEVDPDNTAQHKARSESSDPSITRSSVIFNTVDVTRASASTSLVESHGVKSIVSEGLKAEEMSAAELYHLATAAEHVALIIAKDIHLLKRLHDSYFNYKLWGMAAQYPSVAYQILACTETRQYLYAGFNTTFLTNVLKNDYHLLLLVVGSAELIEHLLYRNGVSVLNGGQLQEIYDFHLSNNGSCHAFMTLLESNPQLKALFENQKTMQENKDQYELHQLEYLDARELYELAKKQQSVAVMIIKHEVLLNKFNCTSNHDRIIDILLLYPDILMDDFFNSSRTFYFDEWAKTRVLSACKQNMKFLLHILNSPESRWLNGCEIEKLIENNSEVQRYIYQVEEFKKRHEAYQVLVSKIIIPIVLTDVSLSTKVKSIYQPIFEQIGAFGQFELLAVIKYLAQSHDHQVLAANSALICDSYHWCNVPKFLAKISEVFFCEMYARPSLRNSLYDESEGLCHKYFIAFESLLQNPEALPHMNVQVLYELQQKWVGVEKNKVVELFNKTPALMQHWLKGYELKKLREGVMVSEYQKQALFQNELDALIQITFSLDNKAFITHLVEHDRLLSTVALLTTTHHEHLLSGVFWFIVLTHQPDLLREALPLDFIQRQMEIMFADLKLGKSIETSWLIKGFETQDKSTHGESLLKAFASLSQPTHYLNSEAEQQQQWFDLVLTGIDINDKQLWDSILQDHYFMTGILDNKAYLERLAILNWECPTSWIKQLTQPQLINVLVHLIANYDDQSMRDRLLDKFLLEITAFECLFKELSSSDEQTQADVYLKLLSNQQMTLLDFLKDQQNIILLRKFDALQQYFIVNHIHETKTDLFELIDSYCKRNLLGDALTIFSLMYESKLVDDLHHLLPNYSEVQRDSQNWLLSRLSGMTAAISLSMRRSISDNVFFGPMIGSVFLMAYGFYEVDEQEESIQISYQNALSRNNISHFFKSDAPSTPFTQTEALRENSMN